MASAFIQPCSPIIGYADLVSIVDHCNLPGTNKAYTHHFVVKNPHVFDEAILNHIAGSKFYEVKEKTPENLPVAHQLKL